MAESKYIPRLRRDYDERIAAAMIERFGYKNRM
jgi:large subunit ribosomal protein L5